MHNQNNKNDKEVLGIIISKNFSLDFCCENALVKIKKTCTKLSAAANIIPMILTHILLTFPLIRLMMNAILCMQKPHFLAFALVIVNPTIFD